MEETRYIVTKSDLLFFLSAYEVNQFTEGNVPKTSEEIEAYKEKYYKSVAFINEFIKLDLFEPLKDGNKN